MKKFDVNDPSTYKYNQDVGFRPIEHEKIICDGCPYAEKDYVHSGKVVIRGSRKAACEKYKYKPAKFLTDPKAICEYKGRRVE